MDRKPGMTLMKVGALISSVGVALCVALGPRELVYVFAALQWLFLYYA